MTTRLEQIKARLEAAQSSDDVCGYGMDDLNDHSPDDLAALLLVAEAAERWEEALTNYQPLRCGEYEDRRTELLKAVRTFKLGVNEI